MIFIMIFIMMIPRFFKIKMIIMGVNSQFQNLKLPIPLF